MTYLEELQSTLDTSKEMLILLVKRIELLSDEHFAYSEYEVNEKGDSPHFSKGKIKRSWDKCRYIGGKKTNQIFQSDCQKCG